MAKLIEYTPPPTVQEYIQHYLPGELFHAFVVGPFGCLAPETLVVTEYGAIPISRIDRPMRVLSWNEKTCQFQLSLCVAAFRKGTDYLYRVTTPEGEFDAAGAHRLLCADGEYQQVADLRVGEMVATYSQNQHPTIEELCRQESRADGLHSRGTAEDCPDGCGVSAHRHDPRSRGGAGIAQEFAPSPACALEYAGYFSHGESARRDDRLERIRKRIHQGLFVGLRQKTHYDPRLGLPVEAWVGQAVAELSAHIEGLGQSGWRSLRNFWNRLRGLLRDGRYLRTGGCEAFDEAPKSLRTTKRPIISITRRSVKQDFWDMCVEGTHNYVTVDGAIHHNSGKTIANFFKLVYMAGFQRPSPHDNIRHTKCVIVRNTMPQLVDTTIASWQQWFKDGEVGTWRATTKTFILRFADVECEVLFRALDTADDVTKVLSMETTFVILDEFVQIAPEIVSGLSGRCGRYPSENDWPKETPKSEKGATNWGMWGASNPGEEDTWWYKHLVEQVPENWRYFHQPSGLSPDAENVEHLPGGTAYYTNLQKGKSEAWIKQFIEAEWGYSVAGRPVVPTFNREIHISKTPLTPNQHLPLVIGYDPGVQNSAMTFGQMDLYGRLLIFGELQMEGYGALRTCTDRLIPLLRSPRYSGLEVIIAPDPAANSRSQTNETTVVEVLRRPEFKKWWSVKVDDTNLLTPRLDAIEHFTTRLTERGPALVIDPSCKGLIRALQGGWRYTTTKRDGDKPTPDKNLSSHVADSMTYLARYHVKNEARVGRRGQQAVPLLPRFGNPYSQK